MVNMLRTLLLAEKKDIQMSVLPYTPEEIAKAAQTIVDHPDSVYMWVNQEMMVALAKEYLEEKARLSELKKRLLDQDWHQKVTIILDYLPKYPRGDTRPIVAIRYEDGTEHPPFLRYSKGPKQGFFWDLYGEDFQSEALALIAINHAPHPRNVGPITFMVPLSPIESIDDARNKDSEQGAQAMPDGVAPQANRGEQGRERTE